MTAEELSVRMSARELTERQVLAYLDNKEQALVYGPSKMDPELASRAVWESTVDLGH